MKRMRVSVGLCMILLSLMASTGCTRALKDGVSIGVTDGLSDGVAQLVSELVTRFSAAN